MRTTLSGPADSIPYGAFTASHMLGAETSAPIERSGRVHRYGHAGDAELLARRKVR